jgi:putative nucleotidyltransferase with HDIG domain
LLDRCLVWPATFSAVNPLKSCVSIFFTFISALLEERDLMNSTRIQVADCNEGDILASDIFNECGVKLVSRDTVVNLYIKERLYEYGIEFLQVYDPPVSSTANNTDKKLINMMDYYKKSALCIKSLVNDLASGNTLDYEKVIYISDLIFQYIDENDSILRVIDAIRLNDEQTYSHSINTAFYSMLIAKWLNFSEKDIRKAVQGGFMHDIGKSKVDTKILNKKEPLTKQEFEIIKKHPVYGYYILDENNFLDMDVKRAVLLHHERTNATGYPFNITAETMGIFAKIVSVADVYDAMTSNRVYKHGVPPFSAFEMFLTDGRTQFDPYLMNEFISHISLYFIGTKVILNSGQSGRIVYIPPNDVLSPIIMVNNEYVNLRKRPELKIERTLC